MAISRKTRKLFRRIGGAVLAVVLLPFGMLFCLLANICVGVAWLFSAFWDFVSDFWQMMTDPGYYRLGCSGLIFRDRLVGMAFQSWSKGDKQEAIAYWRRAARMYSDKAMFRLAQCYENGDGLEKDLSKAYECYNLAEMYHNEQAEAGCQRLEQFAMNRHDRAIFWNTIWRG